jgi:hypothetical protein
MAPCQRGRGTGELIAGPARGNVARMLRVLVVVTLVVSVPGAPRADTPAPAPTAPTAPTPTIDYFQKGGNQLVVRKSRSRTRNQRLLIYGLAGGAAAFAGIAAYFHYDSKSIADELSADSDQNERWSEDHQDKYDRGQLDGKLAIAGYAISAGLIAATIVVVLKTDPGTELETIGPGGSKPVANVVPGGATVGASWSW